MIDSYHKWLHTPCGSYYQIEGMPNCMLVPITNRQWGILIDGDRFIDLDDLESIIKNHKVNEGNADPITAPLTWGKSSSYLHYCTRQLEYFERRLALIEQYQYSLLKSALRKMSGVSDD